MSKIFISYSHKERGPEWRDRLKAALAVFDRKNHVELLDVWSDERLETSADFEAEIRGAMSRARLAVVLITKQSLESDFITLKELPFLRERHERDGLVVWPVVCEKCEWRSLHPWLAALHLGPGGTKPLSEMTDAEARRVLRQSATEIAVQLSRAAMKAFPPEPPGAPSAEPRVYVEKFPLTSGSRLRAEVLVGREQELALLDLAFAQPGTAIASLVAWGGTGKSMLVREWLRRIGAGSVHRDDGPRPWFGARRVYAWSFYSQGTKEDRQASEDTFLAHALSWFGVQCEPTLSPWDKGRLLADAVARERTLLILDGIEPLQYPPGPMGGRLRAPGVQNLLTSLALKAGTAQLPNSISHSLCLVTTREPLTDLVDFQRGEGRPWGSVLGVDLGNLTDDAGAALLHHAGANRAGAVEIKPDDSELLAASRKVDGHALTLNLLGRFLARAHRSDIRRRDVVKFEETDRHMQGGTTFRMLAAFERWFADEGDIEARALTVLRLLGLFDRPADEGCMGVLRSPPVIAGLTEPLFTQKREMGANLTIDKPLSDRAWNDATHFLADFGLIGIYPDTVSSRYLIDCHPLIREHFENRLSRNGRDSWRIAHQRLYNWLDSIAAQRPSNPEELQILHQVIVHGCRAGLGEPVWTEVYQKRIRRGNEHHSVNQLGAFDSDLVALASFFDKCWTALRPEIPTKAKGEILYMAALCLRSAGRFEDALDALRTSLKFESEDVSDVAASYRTLGAFELGLGRISAAEISCLQAVELADGCGIPYQAITAHTTLGNLFVQSGRPEDAIREFTIADKLITANRSAENMKWIEVHLWHQFRRHECQMTPWESHAWRKCLTAKPAEIPAPGENFADTALFQSVIAPIPTENGKPGPVYEGLDRLSKAFAFLFAAVTGMNRRTNLEVFSRAAAEADAAFECILRSGRHDFLNLVQLPRSWIRFLRCDLGGSRDELDAAWASATRSQLPLFMADIHLHRARLFFRENDYPWNKHLDGSPRGPADDLAAAEKLISDCGYHRRDDELADAKRAILGIG